jgi:hypothetical protein
MSSTTFGVTTMYDIATTLSTPRYLDDEGFHRMIMEHKEYIKSTATMYEPSAEFKSTYTDHLKWYLRDSSSSNDMYAITVLINDIDLLTDINDLTYIYIPDVSVINNLKAKYNSIQARMSDSATSLKY